jgi:hypothetical protein
MIVTADQQRRIVLPKPVQPGGALDVSVWGQRLILHVLQKPTASPPTASHALKAQPLEGLDLDEPAFLLVTDESPA